MAVLCLSVLSACNDHEMDEFAISVKASTTQTTGALNRRPVDILFMVDNSNSMCEEHDVLTKNFDKFIAGLANVGADFRIAVINTDATEPTPGAFRTRPGTYNAPGCASPPSTANCTSRKLPSDGIIHSTQYAGLDAAHPETFRELQADFNCLALTGIDGNGTEMGLESMRQALLRNKDSFLRPDALLAIVFISDENDCSDGTLGLTKQGEVYKSVQADSNDRACEFRRNIEDSCTQNSKNFALIPHTYTHTDDLGNTTKLTETRSGLEWCALGDRATIETLSARGDIDVDCPPEGCANQLISRKDFYNFLTTDKDGLNKNPEDIIVAAIINQDFGERYDAADVSGNSRIPSACGRVDTLGYRYELFTNMFSNAQGVVGPPSAKPEKPELLPTTSASSPKPSPKPSITSASTINPPHAPPTASAPRAALKEKSAAHPPNSAGDAPKPSIALASMTPNVTTQKKPTSSPFLREPPKNTSCAAAFASWSVKIYPTAHFKNTKRDKISLSTMPPATAPLARLRSCLPASHLKMLSSRSPSRSINRVNND